MSTLFAFPFGLFALLAVPALAAIYLLRNRFRVHAVSSLMLWEDHKKPRQGGLYVHRLQTPFLFLLELLTLTMLVLAAAGPLIRSKTDRRSFVVVLDNSFSMLAKGDTTPREQGIGAIRDLLGESGDFHVRFVLGGVTPRLLGEPAETLAQVGAILDGWNCLEAGADLSRAVAMAGELAGETGRIVVMTDHRPEASIEAGRLVWRAFGRPLRNVAFVNANRTSFEGRDRVFVAVANLSDEACDAKIVLESIESGGEAMSKTIQLGAGQVHRMVLEPGGEAGALKGRLDAAADNLDLDNEVVLLPEPPRTVRLAMSLRDETLRQAVGRAAEASGLARLSASDPHVIVTDDIAAHVQGADVWTARIVAEPNGVSFTGPFVIDRAHPLAEGLALEGVIWGAGKEAASSGAAVIAAGNIPLLTDRQSVDGAHHIVMNLNSGLSTLLQSPNWPMLFWNLFQWRKQSLPGPRESNILLGGDADFKLDAAATDVVLIDPKGQRRSLERLSDTVSMQPDLPGLYRLETDMASYDIAVNVVSMSESDLRRAESGRWGQWREADLFWWEYRPVDWMLLLLALGLLTVHRAVTASGRGGGV